MATPPSVTDTELKILKALWDRGSSTIRQLTDRLYPGGGTSAYATVQKLLDRLEAKGHVTRERVGRSHRFSAVVNRGDLLKNRLREAVDSLCEGSWTPLLTAAMASAPLSATEIRELRQLLDRANDIGSE